MSPRCCASCGEQVGGHRFSYREVREPYNPEWEMETVRSGEACSRACLIALVSSDGTLFTDEEPL